jgi:UDP-N-acetylmuramate--alanine ligase
VENGTYVFDYVSQALTIKDISCGLPGIHNVENALAAISIALKCGVTAAEIRAGMASFSGVKRRFEKVLVKESITVIDDYAHHPTEIRAAIQSVRDLYPNQHVLGIFQPHLFTRTRDFGDDFALALSELDEIILLPIYPARELPIEGIDSQWLFNKISNPSKKLLEKSELLEIGISEHWEVVLFLGAGDIDQLVHPLTKRMNDERK